jgi:Arc/MetJ family transcription regulator
MRTTLDLNEELIEKARKLTNIHEKTALIHEALRSLIARSAQGELAQMHGLDKKLKPVPRRKAG